MSENALLDEFVIGPDISVWQDDISTPQHVDFPKMVDKGGKFCFIKVSQGTFLDRDYVLNWNNAKGIIRRGGYHYLDWRKGMVEQARFFVGIMQADPGELPDVLDIEERANVPADSAAKIRQFCDEYFRLTGKYIMIYTSWGFWGQYGSADPYWLHHKLWIANYTTASRPAIPAPWKGTAREETFWQFTSVANGPEWGAEERFIDLNRYHGTFEQFEAEFGPFDETWVYPSQMLMVQGGVRIRWTPSTSGDLVYSPVAIGQTVQLAPIAEVKADGYYWEPVVVWISRGTDTAVYGKVS